MCTSTVLAELLDTKELDLEERLAGIEKVHRLIRTSGEEELPNGSLATRYRFAHALYQNMLYEDLLSKRRTLLHRQAGETLVRCYGGETHRIAAALATHFERGRDFPSAIEYLTQAADVALSRYASDAAEEYCSRALTLTNLRSCTSGDAIVKPHTARRRRLATSRLCCSERKRREMRRRNAWP